MNNTIYLSKLAKAPLINYLKSKGFELSFCSNIPNVYNEITTHADIIMCQLGLWENARIFFGDPKLLGSQYPDDIIYNAICTDKYFIHNLPHTNKELLNAAKDRIKLHVSQGYTRCTCLPVDDNSFITSDKGIESVLKNNGANVLLISPKHIKLYGFDYGFIGGTAGGIMIDGKPTMVFNGDLSAHPDYKKIAAFLSDRDIEIVFFKEYPLEDIGSILTGEPYL